MKCSEVGMTGSMTGTSSTLDIVPKFAGCTAFGGLKAEVTVHACELAFHGGKEISTEEFESTLDIACGEVEAAEITIRVPFTGCQITIRGQAGLGGLIIRPGGFFPPDLVIGVQVAAIDAMLETYRAKNAL